MKAIELTGFDGIESLKEVEADRPRPGAGEVLVEVRAAGLNYADIETSRGRYPAIKPLPYVMGFEVAGVVAEVGSGVDGVAVGDRVASLTEGGGLAEYALVDAARVVAVPEPISFEEATTLLTQGLSAYALATYVARLRTGDRVLIQAAAGGVGLFLVQLAKIAGVRQIVALASSPGKLALLDTLGADVTIDYTEPDWARRAREATGGAGFDVVLNCVSGDVARESFEMLAPLGRFVVYGAQNLHDVSLPGQLRQLILDSQSVLGFSLRYTTPEQLAEGFSALLGFAVEGRIKLFADNRFPLSEVREAAAALAGRGTIGKVVLTP
ncbi:zinc-binding dehydrogenase [Amycolatopsis sp. NBC_00345]|uniref:quinone oxidoreductase family protein n=1 Tax=Amycolatopsis sp. NBC_00345 TaxID=2975955 RepID=UPI002E26BC80